MGGLRKGAFPTESKGGSPDAWPQGEQVCALASNSEEKAISWLFLKEERDFDSTAPEKLHCLVRCSFTSI